MSKFRVIAPMGVTLRHPIVLHSLTQDQLATRTQYLEPIEGGKRFKIKTEVSFKKGEIVGIVGDINGALFAALADPVSGETAAEKKLQVKTAKRKAAEEKEKKAAAGDGAQK